jgi:nascent polypeptide-associated complex subunit alpha
MDAEEVIIRTADEELVFSDAQVTRMDAQGTQTYQVVGEPQTRERGAGGGAGADESGSDADADSDAGTGGDIPDDDVQLVVQRAGVSADEAREALEAEDGDLAAAISRLE